VTLGSGVPSTGLPTGSIVGISVSVACSVIGLVFGIGFKIWKHKRKEKLGNAPAVA
jgi:ABC-type arginine transport system permease subunit